MKVRTLFTGLLLVSLFFSFGFVTHLSDDYYEISKNLDIFGRLYKEINTLYVEDTDPEGLMRVGIDAMLESLDPYTNYISEDDVEDVRFMSTGQYGGIGALIGKQDTQLMILEPYQGYPADQAGLKAGDVLKQVDGKEVTEDMQVADVRNLLRGEKGGKVQMTVDRPGQATPITVELIRDRIKIKNVPYAGLVNEEVGYIALSGFTQDAGKEVRAALERMKKESAALKGVILDLRSNPGGRLDESVKVANTFLPQREVVVETRGRSENTSRTHKATQPPVDIEIPLVVLVNNRSASAAEIVAGAVQDLDRGIILGQRSFGKGLVQNIRPLSYNTQLKITTAKYYTPSGRCIQAINYAERNEDGSVSRIPDSLMTAFRTRGGRTVYDGGGIAPDVEMAPRRLHPISQALIDQGLIFDFATQFTNKTPVIPGPRKFEISQTIYDAFLAFVNQQTFTYETRADYELDKLRKIVDAEAYTASLNKSLEALEQELDQQKDLDLNKHQEEISILLKAEIVKRYFYQEGLTQASFDQDGEILRAIELLTEGEEYQKLLKGEI
ncbi:MAG: S41 family peptidase [Bacteroidota bacterium]